MSLKRSALATRFCERNRMSIRQFFKISTAVLVTALLISCGGVSNPPAALVTDAPTIAMVVPQTNGVGTNREVAVVFSKPMDPASINPGSFVVAGASGTVTYDATNRIGAFKPLTPFAPNAMFNATITVAARDIGGTPLAAPFDFSFTTRATKDTSPPSIVAVNVAAG